MIDSGMIPLRFNKAVDLQVQDSCTCVRLISILHQQGILHFDRHVPDVVPEIETRQLFRERFLEPCTAHTAWRNLPSPQCLSLSCSSTFQVETWGEAVATQTACRWRFRGDLGGSETSRNLLRSSLPCVQMPTSILCHVIGW